MRLRPFWLYYGAKWRMAPHYPAPEHDRIVELFAGSACYSLLYPERDVVLVEKDPVIAAVWRYLIDVREEDLAALPDLAPEQSVDDLDVPQAARWLIGLWCQPGGATPGKTLSRWAREATTQLVWGPRVRERLVHQVQAVRHWTVVEADYLDAPVYDRYGARTTWFVDPPYQAAGHHYRTNFRDYASLGALCRGLPGQVIVCEAEGADWLPFRFLRETKALCGTRGKKTSREMIWP